MKLEVLDTNAKKIPLVEKESSESTQEEKTLLDVQEQMRNTFKKIAKQRFRDAGSKDV